MELLDRAIFLKFHSRIAIKYYDSRCSLIEVSYSQLWNDIQRIACSLKAQNIEGQLIGVKLTHCPALIAVLGGIIISGNSFNCIEVQKDAAYSSLAKYRECSAFLFPDRGSFEEYNGLELVFGMRVMSMHVALIVRSLMPVGNKEIAFGVRTSGSTGPPKTVLVPKACIMPNVLALSERFQLSERDVLFVCSPPTFDPFVIDMLLGLRAGATLLMVHIEVRLSPHRVVALLFPGVTFMQITPSLFTRWSNRDITEVILASHSTLRVLVFGGEKFPILQIPPDSRTEVYNIYGITEISCWSLIQKVSYDHRWSDVPLGIPLDSSIVLELRCVEENQKLAIRNDNGSTIGHLFIGSATRKCIVTGDSKACTASVKVLFRATGDVVELTKDSEYIYRGRCERTIKRFGCRVSLQELEEVLLSHESVDQCAACVIGEDVRLILFFTCSKENECIETAIWDHLRRTVPSKKLPDELYRVEHIPLSSHGKVSNDGLLQLYDEFKRRQTTNHQGRPSVEVFRAELVAIGIPDRSTPERDDSKRRKLGSFMDQGGTSIAAVRLHRTMEKALEAALPDLLTYLLDPTVSLEEVLRYLELKHKNILENQKKGSPTVEFNDLIHDNNLSIECRFDMGKCIDARPTVTFCQSLGHILSIGSHSGLLLTIDVETNATVSRLSLPDRIECSVSFFTLDDGQVHGVVGCYDGNLYCFHPLNGTILWKYDAGGMIKCCPLVVPGTNTIIFGSYGSSHNLHCLLGSDTGAVRWKLRIGSKPVFAKPIPCNIDGVGCVLIVTLDGTIASVRVALGTVMWSSTFSRSVPIFSTPAYFADFGKVIACRVDGALSVIDIATGEETSSTRLPGNVFASLKILNQTTAKISLLVGCYDRCVHCVEYLPGECDALILSWKVELQSQIYATPLVVGQYLLVCTTSGYINVLDLVTECKEGEDSLKIVSTLKTNGELFASPVAHGSAVFVGCRDNFLYKIRL
ncbi:beta-alanine-activating enzyme [Anopheles ziemanni]|uniref:beta-alanine-activating enzyme n=1 Tax=Anopheles coustani TaxID=139045 RepID=UPI002657CF67|nr:beta-alanine-activating enzyme [Anopheles coustani]XP_058166230.1 beta-alanine-activating enzyme [Anopheles ziemanni]